jgi:hypothetical protein
MELNEILGYFGALIVGFILGLIGGGGSILTVPILVYLIGLNPITATAYSLFVVGTTSLFGAFQNLKNKMVDLKAAIIFSIPALIAIYLTRRYLVHSIPDSLFTLFNFEVTKDMFIMMFFAIIMFLVALTMIKSKKKINEEIQSKTYNLPIIILDGVIIGIVTGIIGAGGGFLFVPALVILAKIPIKKAIGTSLVIVSINSLIGFLGDFQTLIIDWKFLITFTSISILGIIIGVTTTKYISSSKLKKGFGWFTIIMAIYILIKEIN